MMMNRVSQTNGNARRGGGLASLDDICWLWLPLPTFGALGRRLDQAWRNGRFLGFRLWIADLASGLRPYRDAARPAVRLPPLAMRVLMGPSRHRKPPGTGARPRPRRLLHRPGVPGA